MRKILLLIACLAFPAIVIAQAPESFKYQAVVRNAAGNILADQNVNFRISILQGSASGMVSYSETHNATTNAFGLVNLEIGHGAVESGSFASIDWADDEYFVEVEMDPEGGNSYTYMGTSQLLSVPYALHAKTVETGDDWGTDVVNTDATLDGNGTSGSSLKIAQQGASSGQVLKWSGSTWTPGNDQTGSVTPGGSTGYIQFNNAGNFGGDANLFWDNANKRLGVGTSSVSHPLTISNANNTCYINLSDNQGANGMRIGAYMGNLAFINDNVNEDIIFNTRNSSGYHNAMTISGVSGNVGIGDVTPEATLDVEGTVRVGVNGINISEIREVTGTTDATEAYTSFSYPSGYTQDNTRVLSVEINYNGTNWNTLGMFYLERAVGCSLGSFIYIHYPDLGAYKSKTFRVLLMKVE